MSELKKVATQELLARGKLRAIVEEPDLRLHQKVPLVAEVDEEVRQLMADIVVMMREWNGLGLGAVQVGAMIAVSVINARYICDNFADTTGSEIEEDFICMANPEIVELAAEQHESEEFSFSYPGIGVAVTRPVWGHFRYLDYYGQARKIKAYGTLARCILHEYDHSQGRTILDYASPLKRQMVLKRLEKRKKSILRHGGER